jgi:hypothetical protein
MFIVGPKVTASMSTLSWKAIPSGVADSFHPPNAIALDLWLFRRASATGSYRWTAWRIVLNAPGCFKKTVTSFAYAKTGIRRSLRPTLMPGSESSRERRKGRDKVQKEPCLMDNLVFHIGLLCVLRGCHLFVLTLKPVHMLSLRTTDKSHNGAGCGKDSGGICGKSRFRSRATIHRGLCP